MRKARTSIGPGFFSAYSFINSACRLRSLIVSSILLTVAIDSSDLTFSCICDSAKRIVPKSSSVISRILVVLVLEIELYSHRVLLKCRQRTHSVQLLK
jgi:hypothetical protein